MAERKIIVKDQATGIFSETCFWHSVRSYYDAIARQQCPALIVLNKKTTTIITTTTTTTLSSDCHQM